MHVDRGIFFVLELDCIRSWSLMYFFFWLLMYLFFFLDVFIIYGLYILGGDTMVFVSFIVSCFTCDTLVIDLYYKVIHSICLILCFVKSRIYFVLLIFSTHAFMCLLNVSRIYRLIQSWLLSTLTTNR